MALRAAGRIDVPVVSYLTDPAPHRMWVHPGVDVHLSATTACAVAADEIYGVDVLAAGPLVDPRFSRAHTDADRTEPTCTLGMAPGDACTSTVCSSSSPPAEARMVMVPAAAGVVKLNW